VKAALLDSSTIPSLITVNRIIADLNLQGKGIYLPPRYLREVKAGTVFIPSKEEIIIPPIADVAEGKIFPRNPGARALTTFPRPSLALLCSDISIP